MTTPATAATETTGRTAKPLTEGPISTGSQIAVWIFVVVPFIALVAAVPVAWGWGLSWIDIAIAAVMYNVTGMGITVGFHRYLTHGSFKAKRWMRVMLAVAGSLAVQGPPIQWVADHRRHHAYSDKEGDPHSPWRYGTSIKALAKGFYYAHVGWLFERVPSNRERFAPDLLADRDLRRVDKMFFPLVGVTLVAPAIAGGLLTWSFTGAVTAFFWASLVRISFLHHVTWSINSICHMVGERPFESRDKAGNFWPLAILSFGESWHNLHHADPTCARHGALRGQIDTSARLIWLFEKAGWVYDVRWPKADRLTARLAPSEDGTERRPIKLAR